MPTLLLVPAAPILSAAGAPGDLAAGAFLAVPMLLVVLLLGRRRRRS